MGLLNLTLAQLLAIAIPLTGFLVALYFYDRSRRRLTVSTLRFWPQRPAPPVTRRHKKIQQPWSLLLQVLAMLLLLLALADLRFGGEDGTPRHHAVILDASSTMLSRSADGSPLIDAVRAAAERYIRALPSGDRVMLIRAAGLPSPATSFTDDRGEMIGAVRETQAGWTALDLGAALELADGAFDLALGENQSARGETVVVGADRVASDGDALALPPRLRWIDAGTPAADAAIRRFSAARAVDDPTRWEVALEVRNSNDETLQATVDFTFAGRKLGERTLTVSPMDSAEIDFRIRTEQPGRLEAAIRGDDANPENDRAALELPAAVRQAVDVITDRPARLRSLLGATPNLDVRFNQDPRPGALTVIDGRGEGPRKRAIYLRPPEGDGPLGSERVAGGAAFQSWNAAHPLGTGLREVDMEAPSALRLMPGEGDVVVADTTAGPAVVARETAQESFVVIGFDPLEGDFANRTAGPLLFANAVRWFAPDVFRIAEIRAASPGSVELDVSPAPREQVRVETLSGAPPAWLFDEGRLRLYSPAPTAARVTTPYASARLSLELPESASEIWTPPEDVLRGVPRAAGGGVTQGAALWPWLAVLAAGLLALDWAMYGRGPKEASVRTGEEPLAFEMGEPSAGRKREGVLR